MSLVNKNDSFAKKNISYSSSYIAVVGGANMDIFGRSFASIHNEDSNPGIVSYSPGGVGRNIAENLARMGSSVSFITALGQDTYAQVILQSCHQVGVNTQACLHLKDANTSIYLSILDSNGDMHVAISDMEIIARLDANALKAHFSILQRAKLLILDANLSENALEYLFSNFTDQCIFVDTVSCTKACRLKPYLSSIHSLKPNLKEAIQLSGISINHNAELPKLANWFHQQGVQRIFLSLGAKGVFYSDKNEQALLPAIRVSMLNANGAGDAFLAGLAHSWMQNWTILQSTKFAMAAAVLALSHQATINPNISEMSINHILKGMQC